MTGGVGLVNDCKLLQYGTGGAMQSAPRED